VGRRHAGQRAAAPLHTLQPLRQFCCTAPPPLLLLPSLLLPNVCAHLAVSIPAGGGGPSQDGVGHPVLQQG
jgi:hypothetical protein